MILTERLYLTEDRKSVVRAGDNRAAFLLGVAGSTIPDELAKRLGLVTTRDPEVTTRDPEVTNRDDRRRPKLTKFHRP